MFLLVSCMQLSLLVLNLMCCCKGTCFVVVVVCLWLSCKNLLCLCFVALCHNSCHCRLFTCQVRLDVPNDDHYNGGTCWTLADALPLRFLISWSGTDTEDGQSFRHQCQDIDSTSWQVSCGRGRKGCGLGWLRKNRGGGVHSQDGP